jgi:hypothetical protein
MANPTYYVLADASGSITGNGYTPDGTIPPGAIGCTQAQAQNAQAWQVSNGTLVSVPAPTAAQLLAQAQQAQIATLTAAYQAAIAQPVSYTSKGGVTKTYQADPQSLSNLQNSLLGFQAAGATPNGFYWVASDNTQVPFTYADLQGLAAAMLAQGWAAFQQLQTLKAHVNAATTVSAVQAVVWS